MDKFKEQLAKLNPRERMFLAVGFVGIIVIIMGFGVSKINMSIRSQSAQIEEYSKALEMINTQQRSYLALKAAKEELRRKLENSDSKMVNELTSMASDLDINLDVTPKEPRNLNDTPEIQEQEIELTIKATDYDKFLRLLIKIHGLDSTVFMRRLTIRRTSNNSSATTTVNVTMVLVAYRTDRSEKGDKKS